MSKLTVYQFGHAGLYMGEAIAHESPREPGSYLMPAGTTPTPLPESWPEDKWPRWDGAVWGLVNRPQVSEPDDPVVKLQNFLSNNPDVAALLNQS